MGQGELSNAERAELTFRYSPSWIIFQTRKSAAEVALALGGWTQLTVAGAEQSVRACTLPVVIDKANRNTAKPLRNRKGRSDLWMRADIRLRPPLKSDGSEPKGDQRHKRAVCLKIPSAAPLAVFTAVFLLRLPLAIDSRIIGWAGWPLS
jgi:hypothetical protein